MERIMYDELYSRTINLIDDRQHGFLRNKSCVTNITNLVETLANAFMKKLPTDIIYFDFAKAFDTVNHDLLLKKLKSQYHIDGRMLKFFKNYLNNRNQRVVLDNCNSDIVPVLSGVPQGSILGPLLFVLFINDIYEGIDENSNINLYADDTKLWREITTYADCAILQKDINRLLLLTVPMKSAPRSIFRMNLNIFALFFSITVIPFHALNLSCAEASTLLIIQHMHPYSQISNLPKFLYRTIRMSTSRLAASCIATQFLQHAPPIRIFVTFSPVLSLVSQHCKPVT